MDVEDAYIGRRVREIRTWRRMNLSATAGLAGMSAPYLSMIERGLRPVTKRATLEALARALRVSPAELTGKPCAPSDGPLVESHAAMAALADALTGWWVGEIPDAPGRPWDEVCGDLDRLDRELRPNSEFAAQAVLLPDLIRDLLAAVGDSEHRRAALIGLIGAYKSAGYLAHALGFSGLPTLAVERMRQAADELDDPVYSADVAWRRAHLLSGANRVRQYQLAVTVADSGQTPEHIRGMANLTAALAAATQGQEDLATVHLDEAATMAALIDTDDRPWTLTDFGRTNVGIWRVAIGVELGYSGGKITEVASAVRPTKVPRSRQAAFWIDFGRGLLADRATRDQGLAAVLRAEKLAPQQVRSNVFVRESVADLLGKAHRDAGGRELRGLAWRLGIAPTG